MEQSDLIGVLVVDRHDMVGRGLALLLGHSDPQVSALDAVGSVKDAVERCAVWRPRVVLMDVGLPDGDPREAITRIHAVSPLTNVVLVTGATDDEALALAVDAGCTGYVHKTAGVDALLRAVHAAANGTAFFSPLALARLLHERRSAPTDVRALSDREREVLQLVADGRSVTEIANRLRLSAHTVRNHIRRAMKHLGVHNRLDAVVTAARAGILTVEHPQCERAAAPATQ